MTVTFQDLLVGCGRAQNGSGRVPGRKTVCIQGLGFVGSAMAVAVANARNQAGEAIYQVIGVDLPSEEGQARVRALNAGEFPFPTSDLELVRALQRANAEGNLVATVRDDVYGLGDVVVVDVHCDVAMAAGVSSARLGPLKAAITTVACQARAGALILVETTVPPGTCEKVLAPLIRETLTARGLPEEAVYLAHSYERVMPGPRYYDSVVNFWRVYAGHTRKAASLCAEFLSSVINVRDFPLTELSSTTASETGKVLENSYRAVNIAFVDEWARFAEACGVDLFEVIDAIRVRPTHSNLRQPGFGVGGYCLTKDPLLGDAAVRELFHRDGIDFPFSKLAVQINSRMPLASVDRLEQGLGGSLAGARVLLLGVSYRSDVGDTRYSPSAVFVEEATRRGCEVIVQDPLVDYWSETKRKVITELPALGALGAVSAVVFAVAHGQYQTIEFGSWLTDSVRVVLDANRVLTRQQQAAIEARGCVYLRMGSGFSGSRG